MKALVKTFGRAQAADPIVLRDMIELPKIGIKGNPHIMMMDHNNREIAQVIAKWLSNKGFSEP